MYLAEGLALVGVGGEPGLPEGQHAQAGLHHFGAPPQPMRMNLHTTPALGNSQFQGAQPTGNPCLTLCICKISQQCDPCYTVTERIYHVVLRGQFPAHIAA